MSVERFPFAFERAYRIACAPFGITPRSAFVELRDGQLVARFGPWRVVTELSNVDHTELSGPYSRIKTMGPVRLSFADRGLTMATNSRQGLCIAFAQPVTGIDPTHRLRHPGLTVTVADCAGLAAAIDRLNSAGRL